MTKHLGYWVDQNPWNLVPPPDWILLEMREYDPELVLMPGLTQPVYRLMRKSKAAHAFKPLATDSETGRCARLGLVPVTSILSSPNWHNLRLWLQTHDVWAHGGGDKVADALEAKEKAEAEAIDARLVDEADQRSASSYFGLQVRGGSTNLRAR